MEENVHTESTSIINRAVNTLGLKKVTHSQNESNISEEIKKAIDELENVRSFFDAAEEPELLDYAIYREKAALVRLSYLIRLAKKEKTR